MDDVPNVDDLIACDRSHLVDSHSRGCFVVHRHDLGMIVDVEPTSVGHECSYVQVYFVKHGFIHEYERNTLRVWFLLVHAGETNTKIE